MNNRTRQQMLLREAAKNVEDKPKAKSGDWDKAPTGAGSAKNMGDKKDPKVGKKAPEGAWDKASKATGKKEVDECSENVVKLTAEDLRSIVLDEAAKAKKSKFASVKANTANASRTPLEDPDSVPEEPWEKGLKTVEKRKHAVKEGALKSLADLLSEG